MKIPSALEFQTFIKNNPALTLEGFVNESYCKLFNLDFDQSRKALKNTYMQFEKCCQWLLKCKMNKSTGPKSPAGYFIRGLIKKHYNTPISNGTLIAAVILLKLPYKTDDVPPDIYVGISRKCPFYLEQKAN